MNRNRVHRRDFLKAALAGVAFGPDLWAMGHRAGSRTGLLPSRPNIVLIYADDIGYGDLGCYGAARVKTPNVDRLAKEGILFTRGYASSATCTPSRYSMLTGQYAWRKKGTGVLPGDAGLILEPGSMTLPSMLQRAGYRTGVVGKWHLGLGGGKTKLDWNNLIQPGPSEIGFDYSFLMPATGDRVPCVYVENGRVVNLDPNDPIAVSYKEPFPGLPTGVSHRDTLKMDWSVGHNNAVVNGIGRIGYMAGGAAAVWKDEDMADEFVKRGVAFIEGSKGKPFFLYFATHDIHVPRVPHPRFVGATDMGPRGDAIVQFDYQVGEILNTLDRLGLTENTLVVLTSDNGPVLDDGYKDGAVERVGGHKPAGPLRGGKYSIFEGGTREPFIVRWPEKVKPSVSDAMVSQVDLTASLADLTGQTLGPDDAPDSMNVMEALLGRDKKGRGHIIEHSLDGRLSICIGDWKYIEPSNRRNGRKETLPELYNLKGDIAETANLAEKYADRVKEMAEMLEKIKKDGRTRIQ
ncbi:MAG: arylsulfatase [Planctomycetales bacterium]|nr:arylsulfatase [Planctomycetales bacterium]